MEPSPHVLVIDDESIIRDGCEKILARSGMAVRKAADGREGLRYLQDETFEIVLLDLKMPGLSGMDVLLEIRRLRPACLVIVVTGYATVESAVEAMKEGAYDFIAKPFTPDQLRIVVRRAWDRIVLEREAQALRLAKEKSLRDIATEKGKIRTIINCMPDGVLVADKDEGIVLTNPATARMLGLDEKSLVGQPLFKSIKDDRLVSLIREAARLEGRDLRGISSEISIEGDPPVCLRAHACPVKSDDGEVLGSVTVLEDISYLKELDQMKSDFVSMVSHDLRSPLATIDQQLCVIKEGIAGEVTEKQLEIIEKVRTRIRGLLTFTRNLLDLSKIEAGKTPLYKEPLKLGEIAEKVAESLRQEAQKKDVAMEVTLADDLPVIYGDRDHMEMVFANLVSNAIRYTPAGGRVAVKMEADGNHLKAEVADTGIGIPKADLPRIFDKFYRAQMDMRRRLDGSGLGLFIVKNVVEAHFGTIEVQSEVGRGTTFKVQIPRGAEAP